MPNTTPGDLVKYALGLLALWAIYALAAFSFDFPDGFTANWIAWVVWIPVLALLLMAGVAKAVQIGVRSSRE